MITEKCVSYADLRADCCCGGTAEMPNEDCERCLMARELRTLRTLTLDVLRGAEESREVIFTVQPNWYRCLCAEAIRIKGDFAKTMFGRR